MNDERISKTLSLWLRHRPDAAGITLDSSGWADVDSILAAFARTREAVDWERLLHVVGTNDKQRFELSPDAARLRARQGHSVAVDLEWPEAAPPETLFHGTVERFIAAIEREGLRPMARHHVHLSPDEETARRVGARRGKPVILAVAAARLAAGGRIFRLASNGVWLVNAVPPDFLKRL